MPSPAVARLSDRERNILILASRRQWLHAWRAVQGIKGEMSESDTYRRRMLAHSDKIREEVLEEVERIKWKMEQASRGRSAYFDARLVRSMNRIRRQLRAQLEDVDTQLQKVDELRVRRRAIKAALDDLGPEEEEPELPPAEEVDQQPEPEQEAEGNGSGPRYRRGGPTMEQVQEVCLKHFSDGTEFTGAAVARLLNRNPAGPVISELLRSWDVAHHNGKTGRWSRWHLKLDGAPPDPEEAALADAGL